MKAAWADADKDKINKMNPKPKNSVRRKSSISELKLAIKKVKNTQYETKVKALQISRNSRSPTVKKSKTHSKSRSMLIDYSQNQLYSRPDISNTNIEYGLKSPELFYLEEDLKNLRSENFELKQKLASIKKDYDMLIIQIRNQLEQDKQLEIANLTKFYISKLAACEENFELKFRQKLETEGTKIREETKKSFENKFKELLDSKTQDFQSIQQFLKTDKEQVEQMDLEYRLKLVLDSKTGEFERKIMNSNQENLKLRKENESLRGKIIELQAKLDAASYVNDKDLTGNKHLKYSELLQDYNTLKIQLENKAKENCCVKCKAFLNTNDEVSRKILRIREFLSN